jgi:cytochrome P450
MIDHDFIHHPYPAYDALLAAGPVHWSTQFCGGAWLLPRYADVLDVLRDARLSTQRAGRWINGSGPQARTELREFKRIFSRSLLFLNGAQHARLRRVMNAGFKPGALQALAPRIERIVDRLCDRFDAMAEAGSEAEVDFIRDFARQLPALVIADMLAIDPADQSDFVAWSDDIAHFIGSPTPSMEVARQAQSSLVALNDYFRALLPQRRLHPGDDLISQLIRAEATGGVITTNELLAQCCTLLFAGHETTRNLLGNGFFSLLQHPAQLQDLKDNPALMPSALRELLRFDSPVQYTGRILTSDIDMHGHRMKKGQLVIALIGAANRDPARFTDPARLDLARNQGNHLSFGYGPHVCIGAQLTYLEAGIALTTLLKRFPAARLAGSAATWGSNPLYRGLASLPVHLVA